MIAERLALLTITVGVVVCAAWAYVVVGSRSIDRLQPTAARRAAPWLWVGPAGLLVTMVLVYPALSTLVLSLRDADEGSFVGLANYSDLLGRQDTMVALRNTLLWVLGLPLVAGAVGLAVAVLTDRAPYGGLVKAVLFLPIAISAVAAGVIWRFMYDYRPAGSPQTGTLNAVLVNVFGTDPVAWLIEGGVNNPALIATAVWTQAGFCMVIFSAALRGIPTELYEAAAIDGASPWRQFTLITFPLLVPTMTVVMTTMAVIALKAFDIVYVMTNGSYDTDVLATLMYKELFSARDEGRAGALAVLIMVAVVPVMYLNLRQFRRGQQDAP